MSLTQLLNMLPANAEGRGLPTLERGRDASAPSTGFEQVLQQSQQQPRRSVRHAAERLPAAAPRQARDAAPDHDARIDEGRVADAQGRATADASSREGSATAEDGGADSSQRSARHLDDGSGAGPETALSDLRAWVEQLADPSETAETLDLSALTTEELDQLASALTNLLADGDATPASADPAAGADELGLMMQALTTSHPSNAERAAVVSDLLQSAMGGRAAGAGSGTGSGLGTALGFADLDLAALAGKATSTGESAGSGGEKLGQAFAEMPWLASAVQAASGGTPSEAGMGARLEAMLSQLATATATANGQAGAAGEALTPVMQASQSGGQPLGGHMPPPGAGQPAMSESDMQANAARVARAMNSAVNQGGGTLTLRMTPAEMGTVRIQLQVQGGTVNAALHAESDGARSLLTQQLSQLRQALESQGLNVERLSVQSINSSTASGNSSQQGQADGAPHDGRSRGEHGGSGQRHESQQDDAPHQQGEAFEQAMFDQTLNETG